MSAKNQEPKVRNELDPMSEMFPDPEALKRQGTIRPKDSVDPQPKVAIVGEFPTKNDLEAGLPFSGYSGKELATWLRRAGINRSECYETYVLKYRPPDGKLAALCGKKGEVGGPKYSFSPVGSKYLAPIYLDCLQEIREELQRVRPNIVFALGQLACWALVGQSKIGSYRGNALESVLLPGLKVLPAFSPSYILANWSQRVVSISDTMKLAREMESPELQRVNRTFWLDPEIKDLHEFERLYFKNATSISVDIETARHKTGGEQITCIGFAPNSEVALNIPFVDVGKPGYHYWQDPLEEVAAWFWVKKILEGPIPKGGQNFTGYDVFWLYMKLGIKVAPIQWDTMLKFHAIQPEMSKNLGFLISIFCDEGAVKNLAPRGRGKQKREE